MNRLDFGEDLDPRMQEILQHWVIGPKMISMSIIGAVDQENTFNIEWSKM